MNIIFVTYLSVIFIKEKYHTTNTKYLFYTISYLVSPTHYVMSLPMENTIIMTNKLPIAKSSRLNYLTQLSLTTVVLKNMKWA